MKINSSTPPSPLKVGSQSGATDAKARVDAGSSTSGTASAVGHLSNSLSDATHDIDSLRVSEVRQAILDGRLLIDAEKIADGLLENLKGI